MKNWPCFSKNHWFMTVFHCFRHHRFPLGISRKVSKMGKTAKIHENVSKKCPKTVIFLKNCDFRHFWSTPASQPVKFVRKRQFCKNWEGGFRASKMGNFVIFMILVIFMIFVVFDIFDIFLWDWIGVVVPLKHCTLTKRGCQKCQNCQFCQKPLGLDKGLDSSCQRCPLDGDISEKMTKFHDF